MQRRINVGRHVEIRKTDVAATGRSLSGEQTWFEADEGQSGAVDRHPRIVPVSACRPEGYPERQDIGGAGVHGFDGFRQRAADLPFQAGAENGTTIRSTSRNSAVLNGTITISAARASRQAVCASPRNVGRVGDRQHPTSSHPV